jgi:hypothetical protein
MKWISWLSIAAVALLAACSSAPKPAASSDSASATPASITPDTGSENGMPVPPPGAMYTMFCCAFTSPTHIADAAQAKQYLITRTGLKDWYVIHSEAESDLFFGFYKTFDDVSQTQEYNRAQTDHAKITSLVNDVGDPIFSRVIFVPINMPDPPAPKEWDLKNNPGYWTLQIGIYRDSPQRKEFAVEAVREARAQGIEAYYQHGAVASGVFIGAWPKEAASISDTTTPTQDPHQPVLVLSSPIAGAENNDFETKDGQKMHVVMPQIEIYDPGLKAAIAKYPYTEINGQILGRASPRHPEVIPYPSYLIRVPHDDTTDASDKDAIPDMQQTPPPDQDQPPPPPDQDQPNDGMH